MQQLATQLLTSEQFDIVQFESSQMSWLQLPEGVVSIVDEHNIEYELLQRMYQTETSRLRKLYNWSEFRKFRREERGSWKRADGCVVTSEREQVILSEIEPHKPVHVAPNGVDIDFFSASDVAVDPNSIVFTGLLHYRPNIDAVTFFTKQILPHIVEQRPDVVFSIVGLGAPSEVTRLAGPNVRFVGEVPDIRPYALGAGALVVPLRMGSGTRLKVLDGLAMQKGLISTALGCEGIEVADGQHLLIADGPEQFAQAVLSVLDDPALAERLGRHGRALVEAKYSWVSIVEELERFHRRVIDGSSSNE
jgi:glycosyltransferase involved in cell wall biosynthesis